MTTAALSGGPLKPPGHDYPMPPKTYDEQPRKKRTVAPRRQRVAVRRTEEDDYEAGRDHERNQRNVSIRRLAIVEAALADGKSPLHVMLANMSYFQERAERLHNLFNALPKRDQEEPANQARLVLSENLRATASSLAKDAAPYVHPKLAAIEMTGTDGGALELMLNMPAGERRRKIDELMARMRPLGSGPGPVIQGKASWRPPVEDEG